MKNALIGIFCALVVIALLFGYSSSFDYTYDGKEYGVDFETPTQINSNKIEESFHSLYVFGNGFVGFVRKSINVIVDGVTGDISLEDCDNDAEFRDYINDKLDEAEAYIKTLGWWTRTFIAPGRLESARALVREGTYSFGYYGSAYNYKTDIETFKKYLGWSDEDILYIHEWCVAHERTHTYKNELYDYRE